jgi:hypothetical protein
VELSHSAAYRAGSVVAKTTAGWSSARGVQGGVHRLLTGAHRVQEGVDPLCPGPLGDDERRDWRDEDVGMLPGLLDPLFSRDFR